MKATVSEKGQITIPKRLRDRLGIRPGEVLDLDEEGGWLVARKSGSHDNVAELYGTLTLGEPVEAHAHGLPSVVTPARAPSAL
jgi:AbrB family looped-hinge helix DNA binding protein